MSFVGSINDNPRREWAPATRRVIYLIAKVPGRLSMPLPHPPTSASSVVAAEIYNVSIDDIILLSRRRQPIQPTIMDMYDCFWPEYKCGSSLTFFSKG
jgi:hypothetical protein